MYHYTYRITNLNPTDNRKYYYGVRSSKCHPKYDNYWSSSKYLKEDINKLGKDNFKKKIIKIFITRQEALKHEIFLHNKFNVAKNSVFYNRAKQTNTGFDITGTNRSQSSITRQKISSSSKGKILSETHKNNIKIARQKQIMKPISEKTRLKMSLAATGKSKSKEHIRKITKSRKGYIPSTNTKKKASETMKNKPKVTCPHCNISGGKGPMTLWHFDNCKFKIDL